MDLSGLILPYGLYNLYHNAFRKDLQGIFRKIHLLFSNEAAERVKIQKENGKETGS